MMVWGVIWSLVIVHLIYGVSLSTEQHPIEVQPLSQKRLWTELLPCFLNRPNIPAWLSLVQTARLRSEEWLRAVSVIHMPINSLAISIRGVMRKAPTIKVRHMSHTVELVITTERRLTTFGSFHVLNVQPCTIWFTLLENNIFCSPHEKYAA